MSARPVGRREHLLLGMLAILVVSLCCGLAANHRAQASLPLFASEASLRAWVPPTVKYASTKQARAEWGKPGVLFLDGRAPEGFAEGHVAGALSLPVDAYGEHYPALRARLRRARVLICYCESISCDEGARLAALLAGAGYPRVEYMFAGWEGWQQEGGPGESG